MSKKTYFQQQVRRIGFVAAVRQAKNLGVSFIDCYVAAFGRMPERV